MNRWLSIFFNEFLRSDHPPTKIASWGVITLLFTTTAIVLAIMRSRIREERKAKNIKIHEEEYEIMLTDFVFEEDNYQTDSENYQALIKSLKKADKDELKRAVLINTMLQLHRELKGHSTKRLEQLYQNAELHLKAERKLLVGEWYDKAKAIKELGQMQVRSARENIVAYLDHYIKELRDEALYASIRLGGQDGLSHLYALKNKLSEWQQTRLIQELDRFDLSALPNFNYLLSSDNKTVVSFALKLIAHYGQMENSEELKITYFHENDYIKCQVIESIQAIGDYEALPWLLEHFNEGSTKVKGGIIKAVGTLGDKSHTAFLSHCLQTEVHEVALQSARALVKLMGQLTPAFYIKNEHQHLLIKQALYEMNTY